MKKMIIMMAVAVMITAILQISVLTAPNDKLWQTVSTSLTYSQQVTYAQLTDYCINQWGLSENPYPKYPASAVPDYYLFELQIGDDVYEGVSCNTQL